MLRGGRRRSQQRQQQAPVVQPSMPFAKAFTQELISSAAALLSLWAYGEKKTPSNSASAGMEISTSQACNRYHEKGAKTYLGSIICLSDAMV